MAEAGSPGPAHERHLEGHVAVVHLQRGSGRAPRAQRLAELAGGDGAWGEERPDSRRGLAA
eukprot:10510786-Alexandrium_andersonii.AAC.1